MMKTLDEVSFLIKEGRLLHVAGNGSLLRQLPKGNWIGGSTEYFMTEEGGVVSDSLLFVTEFDNDNFTICDYGMNNISQVATEAYNNGFTVLIIPLDSELHMEYARNSPQYESMYLKDIVGWVSGVNIKILGQSNHFPIVVNGITGKVYSDRAVALHLEVPESQNVSVNIINIFSPDENAPPIEFDQEGFTATTCRVDGKEMMFDDYITQNNLDMKLPIIGNFFGHGINVDIRSIENGEVRFGAPVFTGVKYYRAKDVPDYEAAFNASLMECKNVQAVFSCNCLSNFMRGGLEGKKLGVKHGVLLGPVVFGEITYQLLSQTLVYVTVE